MKDKYHYEFLANKFRNQFEIQNVGLYLVIVNAHLRPPHVGIIRKQGYFSLKWNGVDLNIPSLQFIEMINKKNIPTLFFQLKNNQFKNRNPLEIFRCYKDGIASNQSCLSPIIELLDIDENLKCRIQNIGELLKYLYTKEIIIERYYLNLPSDFKGIPYYPNSLIKSSISQLKYARK